MPPRAPGCPAEYPMIVYEVPLLREPTDAQQVGHCALAWRQNGPDQQNLGVALTPLEKERRKAQDHRGEAGWQVQHGGVSGWGRIQPNQSPASPPMPTSDGQSRAKCGAGLARCLRRP
jgi:hypothetical protein